MLSRTKSFFSETVPSRPFYAALLLLLVAFAFRVWFLGHPFLEDDEEFYLFVGGQILQGHWPYIDIWDRKPIGLFLIYAFFHLFGGWRIWAYQLGGLLSVWATALLVLRLGRLIAPFWGGFFAAILYIAWMNIGRGEGGQSPVFYNLPVTLGMALIALHLPELQMRATQGWNRGRKTGLLAMLLFGVAMQIKYTAIFEGIFAGCFLLYHSVRCRRPWPLIAGDGLLWIGCALLPSLLAYGVYSLAGHGQDWLFANVTSILHRKRDFDLPKNSRWMSLHIGLLLAIFPLRRFLGFSVDKARQEQNMFLNLWAIFAVLAVACFGTYFKHYLLPVIAPFAVIAAPLVLYRLGRLWLAILFALAAIVTVKLYHKMALRIEDNFLEKAVTLLSSPQGCVYDYGSIKFMALLDDVPYCPSLTHYPFAWHLAAASEQDALGIDTEEEMRHILAQHPRYLISEDVIRDNYSGYNQKTRKIFVEGLKDYKKIYGSYNQKYGTSFVIYQYVGK